HAAASPAQADYLPRGRHYVAHQFRFEGMEKYPQYDFYLFSDYLRDFHITAEKPGGEEPFAEAQPTHIQPGCKYSYYKQLHPKVRAVKAGTPVELVKAQLEKSGGLAQAEGSLNRFISMPDSDPLHRVETVYRIQVEGKTIQLVKVKERRFGRDGRE